jgi:cation:H+ antiporter
MLEQLNLPIGINLMLFAGAAAAVWIAGGRLSLYADIIADRTGISKAVLGFIFLATVTQLPEIVTNTTGAIRGSGTLVVNSMFGGIAMQTAVLAMADLVARGQVLTFYTYRSGVHLQGIMLILALAMLLAATELGEFNIGWQVGLWTLLMAMFYVLAVFLLWRYEGNSQWKPINTPEEKKAERTQKLHEAHQDTSLHALQRRSLLGALVILLCGVALVDLAETIAAQTGLGSSFIGVTLLASATSLPEFSTVVAAIRLGSHGMAVSDIFGSNLIMVFLLLPSDIFYREGVLLSAVDTSAQFALVIGVVLTAIYLVGLYMRSSHRLMGMGLDSWAVLTVYLASLFAFYQLR